MPTANAEALIALAARCESATEGSRELDGEIAIAIGYIRPWLSKHRYWNFERQDGKSFHWPDRGIPEYDSQTGKKIILTDIPHDGWQYEGWADFPDYSSSIDAALRLVPEGHSVYLANATAGSGRPLTWLAVVQPWSAAPPRDHRLCASPAFALAAAALRAVAVNHDR